MDATQRSRRRIFKGAVAAVATAGLVKGADAAPEKKVYRTGPKPATPPMYSAAVSYGNLIFLPGIVAPASVPADIKSHTEYAIGEIRKRLEAAGSSLEKVLKCTVLLADMKDFAGMNEVYLGKFGDDPPVRTSAAVAGIPGNSLIEIDVIAYI